MRAARRFPDRSSISASPGCSAISRLPRRRPLSSADARAGTVEPACDAVIDVLDGGLVAQPGITQPCPQFLDRASTVLPLPCRHCITGCRAGFPPRSFSLDHWWEVPFHRRARPINRVGASHMGLDLVRDDRPFCHHLPCRALSIGDFYSLGAQLIALLRPARQEKSSSRVEREHLIVVPK
jgi:hypothetical protein